MGIIKISKLTLILALSSGCAEMKLFDYKAAKQEYEQEMKAKAKKAEKYFSKIGENSTAEDVERYLARRGY
ncbi:MAG: hypothetical protein WC438_04690 [Candidatus Pacearchaeota archaeon]